ncbi:hotdog fold thioesterase [Sanguibacter sp. 25GB23B1]|uniref:hotdog fold thioesterase n=1 Tax=unclassified Sanguibacter TaxID=2645534 RepID=UPI0032AEDE01
MTDMDITEALAASSAGTLIERMGITLLTATPERVVGTMPVHGNTQPAGLLHGGASVVLAETLGSFAAQLHAGEGRSVVGIEVNATHHHGPRDGIVTGVATPVHRGRTTASYEIVIETETGRRVCTARLTCLVLVPQ